jgi:hypothetical protein
VNHWGYVLEQIAQGDERTRVAQRHHRQRRGVASTYARRWLAKPRSAWRADLTSVPTSIGPLSEAPCARAADLSRGALA